MGAMASAHRTRPLSKQRSRAIPKNILWTAFARRIQAHSLAACVARTNGGSYQARYQALRRYQPVPCPFLLQRNDRLRSRASQLRLASLVWRALFKRRGSRRDPAFAPRRTGRDDVRADTAAFRDETGLSRSYKEAQRLGIVLSLASIV